MKDFVYNKGGTAIIRPLHFHDVKGFLLRIIRIMRGIYKEEVMSKNLEKTYNPKEIEAKLYERWCENKYFHAEVDRSKKPFTIVMPPPNITGKLHMGHALDNTLQDILIRYKRMQGYNALWIPGTDHAAISTEVKVTNQLKEEGIDKKELGREGFLKRTWEWKEEYGGTITQQLKKLGTSCDWDRERFTMDEGCSKAVEEVFIKLYEEGYIYKGSRIINWPSPRISTVITAWTPNFLELIISAFISSRIQLAVVLSPSVNPGTFTVSSKGILPPRVSRPPSSFL